MAFENVLNYGVLKRLNTIYSFSSIKRRLKNNFLRFILKSRWKSRYLAAEPTTELQQTHSHTKKIKHNFLRFRLKKLRLCSPRALLWMNSRLPFNILKFSRHFKKKRFNQKSFKLNKFFNMRRFKPVADKNFFYFRKSSNTQKRVWKMQSHHRIVDGNVFSRHFVTNSRYFVSFASKSKKNFFKNPQFLPLKKVRQQNRKQPSIRQLVLFRKKQPYWKPYRFLNNIKTIVKEKNRVNQHITLIKNSRRIKIATHLLLKPHRRNYASPTLLSLAAAESRIIDLLKFKKSRIFNLKQNSFTRVLAQNLRVLTFFYFSKPDFKASKINQKIFLVDPWLGKSFNFFFLKNILNDQKKFIINSFTFNFFKPGVFKQFKNYTCNNNFRWVRPKKKQTLLHQKFKCKKIRILKFFKKNRKCVKTKNVLKRKKKCQSRVYSNKKNKILKRLFFFNAKPKFFSLLQTNLKFKIKRRVAIPSNIFWFITPSAKSYETSVDSLTIEHAALLRKKINEALQMLPRWERKKNAIAVIVNRSNKKLLKAVGTFIKKRKKWSNKKLKKAFEAADDSGLLKSVGILIGKSKTINKKSLKLIKNKGVKQISNYSTNFFKKFTSIIPLLLKHSRKKSIVSPLIKCPNKKLLVDFNNFVKNYADSLNKDTKEAFKIAENVGLLKTKKIFIDKSKIKTEKIFKLNKIKNTIIEVRHAAALREQIKNKLPTTTKERKSLDLFVIINRSNKDLIAVLNTFVKNPNSIVDKQLKNALELAHKQGFFEASGILTLKSKIKVKKSFKPIKIKITPIKIKHIAALREQVKKKLLLLPKWKHKNHRLFAILARPSKALIVAINTFAKDPESILDKQLKSALELAQKQGLLKASRICVSEPKIEFKKSIKLIRVKDKNFK